MNVVFEELSERHQIPVIDIYNYYIKTSTAAFPNEPVPYDYFIRFLDIAKNYPAYAVVNENSTAIGFCMLSDYIAHNTFRATASLTYFLSPEYTGKGIGSMCIAKLEEEAKKKNITNLISDVSSENSGSISFHKKHGFTVIGELNGIASKFGRDFGLVLMLKKL
jgi:Sortase and related acyltransferases